LGIENRERSKVEEKRRNENRIDFCSMPPHPVALKKTFGQLPLSRRERGGGAADGVRESRRQNSKTNGLNSEIDKR
jgi:hypothetical protein